MREIVGKYENAKIFTDNVEDEAVAQVPLSVRKLRSMLDENLLSNSMSYFVGFIQTDGSYYETTRNRGKLVLELSARDADIIHKFNLMFPDVSKITVRTRDTNFKKNYNCAIFSIHNLAFRSTFKHIGVPLKNKAELFNPPTVGFSTVDYIRGIWDGNGSLGITGKNRAYASIVCTTDNQAKYILDFLYTLTGKRKTITRNARDCVYNIMVTNEDAQLFASTIYYTGCLALNRKIAKAEEVMAWKRPNNIPKKNFKAKE